ncbi:MAG: hypothetical protein MRY63_11555 [Neomegalonema sp.]|nr:hypothetical protein [Neomegalonema sp.]
MGFRSQIVGAAGDQACVPKFAPKTSPSHMSEPALQSQSPRPAGNNRLTSGIHGARRSKRARWEAFDQLPVFVADAIRDSRSLLCPVAALRLVNKRQHSPEDIARFLRQRAAWTDWRVLAADFGEYAATQLRPDAPSSRPKLRRQRA